MAWTASGWYVDTLRLEFAEDIAFDLELLTHKLALYTNSLTPDFSAATPAYSATNEVSGTAYTAGGKVVTGTTLGAASGFVTWDGSDVSWDSSTITGVRGGIIYADSLAGNNLIVGINFGADYATNDGTLLVAWSSSGIARISA
ncbi:hypothetical protein [Nonomuraea sp. NPDC003804]|uniref:hypothetical protein n=1 Tax=Nonomuraea sp. NPDC003804 TaxID=3154547 RepID=UPI0033A335AB